MSEEDPKAENIMKKVYIGNEATKCDGMVYGYSNFMHILTSKPKKLTGKDEESFFDMITIDFNYKFDVDYTFQHRYRSRSIHTYFLKDMFFAVVLCIFNLAIFFDYNSKFRGKDIYYQSQNKTWNVCNEADDICHGSGTYDFA